MVLAYFHGPNAVSTAPASMAAFVRTRLVPIHPHLGHDVSPFSPHPYFFRWKNAMMRVGTCVCVC